MISIAELEAQIAERQKTDRQRLARALAKADEDLGARLRALVAPGLTRAEQVAKASAWLAKQSAQQSAQHQPGHATAQPEHGEGH